MKIKVFDYNQDLDCFFCTDLFTEISDALGLTEWSPVVWIGRLFNRDQDFGEHWFDNWDERDNLWAEKKSKFPPGKTYEDALIIVTDRLTEPHEAFCIHCKRHTRHAECPNCSKSITVGGDGPCTSDKLKKMFWTDILSSLEISLETMFEAAREFYSEEFSEIPDLEKVIQELKGKYGS